MRTRRRFAVQPMGRPTAEINVTPLVDVVLVLLIIFMVVTPLLEKDIGVRMPAIEQVEDVREVPADQIVVRLAADGALHINAEEVATEGYVGRLRAILGNRADKTVFVAAEDDASYARLVTLLDGARQAGATTLGMTTEPAPE